MRGLKAKALRRYVYEDFSQRERAYRTDRTGAVRAIGKRRLYQDLKKHFLHPYKKEDTHGKD